MTDLCGMVLNGHECNLDRLKGNRMRFRKRMQTCEEARQAEKHRDMTQAGDSNGEESNELDCPPKCVR
jgi:hypothetical protein